MLIPDIRSLFQDHNVSRSLPRSFKLTNHAATSFYDVAKDTLFVTKCIALVMQLPYVVTCKKFLTALYQMAVVNTEPPRLNIESYIYNLLYEVPLPDPKTSLKFYCVDKPFICHRPGMKKLSSRHLRMSSGSKRCTLEALTFLLSQVQMNYL